MSKTSKTTQENRPPQWAEGLFKTSAADAQRLYDSGVGGNTYTGSTVSDLSGTTMQGVNQLAQAGQNWDTAGTRPLFGQIGSAAVSNPFMGQLGNLAKTTGGIGTEYGDVYKRAQDPTAASTYLTDYASGKNLKGEGNPFYRQRLEGDLADTAAQVNSSMSGAGRFGSGAHTGTLTNELQDQRVAALENDWNREQANQFNATGMIDAANQAALGTQLGALGGKTNAAGLQGNMLSNAGGMYSTGIGQAQTAAGSMAGLDQQNFQNRLTGAGATLQAGNILDTQAQKLLSDDVAKWYATDNEDWTRLGMLQTAAAGAAGPYGSQVATSRQPVGIGGIAQGLGALFGGKCDRRLKENIIELGAVNGIRVYAFNYRGRDDRFIGPMAQDLLFDAPEAVFLDDGFWTVDFRKLGFPLTRIN